MSNDKCPHCGSTNLGPGGCNNCGVGTLLPPPPPASTADTAGSGQIPPPSSTALSLLPAVIPAAAAGGEPTPKDFQDADRDLTNATTQEEKDKAWEVWENTLFNYRDRGYSLVTLIGLSGAGKTFYANRLRRELRLRKGWTVDPFEEDTILQTDRKIECTQIVRNGRRRRRRVLADCDGEAYREAIERLLKGEPVADLLRRYVMITSLASAYILMVPAPEQRDKTKDLIERFGVIVSAILALQLRLRETGNAKEVVRRGLTPEDLRLAKESEFTSERPVHVLFSQADRFQTLAPYTEDPLQYAIARAPELVRTIDNHFTNYRFDFVSAFYGHPHTNGTKGAVPVDYSQPHYGVVPAFDWIDTMIERPRFHKYDTRVAMSVRSLVDSAFRKTAKSKEVR